MSAPLVIERRDGGRVDVWLDRPERRNAIDAALIAGLRLAVDELAADEGVRCLVLGGRGAAFCAGADAGWMAASADLTRYENVADAERMAELLAALDSFPRPTIARVQGFALGGGTGFACCCDIVHATRDARFGFSEVRLGLIPATIAPYAIARIGLGHARALFLTGEQFDAARAERIGIAHHLHDDEPALDAGVDASVAAVLAAGPLAVAHAKRLAYAVAGHDPAALRRVTAEAIAERRASAEGQEGLRAFLERRRPEWPA